MTYAHELSQLIIPLISSKALSMPLKSLLTSTYSIWHIPPSSNGGSGSDCPSIVPHSFVSWRFRCFVRLLGKEASTLSLRVLRELLLRNAETTAALAVDGVGPLPQIKKRPF
jgi:hypothetical protein